MASVSLLVCPPASIALRSDGYGGQYAVCADGQGSVQQVVLAEPFDPSSLSAADLGAAFAVGFSMMATGLIIVWCARFVVQAIRSAL